MANYFSDFSINAWRDGVRAEAREALEVTVEEGADQVREIIHLSTTRWGEERQRGLHGEPRPFAGRIEDGHMYDDVSHRVEEDGDTIVGYFGWQDPQDYYLVQEHGAQQGPASAIVPMESLATSLMGAEDRLQGRLDRIDEG